MNFSDKSLANALKDAACEIFLSALDKVVGSKDIVLSQSILVQLDAVCGMTKLRQNAVDKVFKFEATPVNSETPNRVYVIRPTIEETRRVAQHINAYLNQDDDKFNSSKSVKFFIIFAPKLVHYCEVILEEEGVYEYVSILECPLGLFPLEYDVYSLEDETIFSTLFLNKDITPLSVVVNSILQLQLLSGNIFNLYGQGNFSKIVADKLDQANLLNGIRAEGLPKKSTNSHDVENIRFNKDSEADEKEPKQSFTDIYLIDRDCDYCSVLLSQSNYEGFLDESFGICCNKLEFSDDKTSNKHSLASDMDPIYRDVRDNHFSTVFSLLKTRMMVIKGKYTHSQGKFTELDLSNLKSFVAHELRDLQTEFKCLGIHISACEEIMRERNKYDFSEQLRNEQNILEGVEIRRCLDYITKLISHRLQPNVPLRLLSLLSLTQGGLPPRDYNKFLSLYCETYGLQNNATFNNLKRLGLVTEMNLSLQALTGGVIAYGSDKKQSQAAPTSLPSSLSLASFAGAMSSFTEKASGRMAAVVSSSVLPRRGNLSAMIKKFQLMPEISDAGYNIRDPRDPAFVYNGAYIPLICQLIDHCVLNPPTPANKRGATPINTSSSELTKLLSGPNFKRRQAFIGSNQSLTKSSSDRDLSESANERSILIYFIGGVTFAEITALRFLAKQRNVKIAIATTSIINGNKLMNSIYPKGTIRHIQPAI